MNTWEDIINLESKKKYFLELMEKIGITCEEMKDKDSRKLIFVNEELKLKFLYSY